MKTDGRYEDERRRRGGKRNGASLPLAFQWRFIGVPKKRAYHWADPYIAVGGLLGGLQHNDKAHFRAALYVSGGLDFRITKGQARDGHGILGLRYRYYPTQIPEGPAHMMLVAIGFRIMD